MDLAYFQLFYEVNNFSCKLLRCILLLEKKALVDMWTVEELSSVYSSHWLGDREPLLPPRRPWQPVSVSVPSIAWPFTKKEANAHLLSPW